MAIKFQDLVESPITGALKPGPERQPEKIGFQGPINKQQAPKKRSLALKPEVQAPATKPQAQAKTDSYRNPFSESLSLLDPIAITKRMNVVKTGFRQHRGYSPDPDTLSRFVFNDLTDDQLSGLFNWKPNWLTYHAGDNKYDASKATASIHEGERIEEVASIEDWQRKLESKSEPEKIMLDFIPFVGYSNQQWFWNAASEAVDEPSKLTDTKWLLNKMKSNPYVEFMVKGLTEATEKGTPAGLLKMAYRNLENIPKLQNENYRREVAQKAPYEALDSLFALAAIASVAGIKVGGKRALDHLKAETIPGLLESIPPEHARIITREIARGKRITYNAMLGPLTWTGAGGGGPTRRVAGEGEQLSIFGKKVMDDITSRYPGVKNTVDDVTGELKKAAQPSLEEMPKYAGSINLNRLDAETDVKEFILETSKRYEGKISEARRGTIKNEETQKLADQLGMSVSDVLKRKKGQAYNAEQVTAAREINLASAESTWKAAKQAAESDSTENLIKFQKQLQRHVAIQAEVSGVSTEAGRALQAHKILAKSEPAKLEADALKAMIESLGGREITKEIAERMSKIDPNDITAVNKFIRETAKVKTTDKVFEAWVNSILSGPLTHIVNITSNTLTALSRPVERSVAATLDFLRSAATGKRFRFLGEVPADFVGMAKGVTDGVRKGIWAFINEMPTDNMGKIETNVQQAIKGRTGKVIRTPGRLLVASDEFFKTVNYTGDLYAGAYRKAAIEGLKGKERVKKMAEFIDKPTEDLTEAAHADALYRTFTQPLGTLGKTISKARNYWGIKYIIPFMRTPVNIAKYGIERTPIEFLNMLRRNDFKNIPDEAIDKLARATMGSLMGAGVVTYAKQGLITGSGPTDKAERDALYRRGWQPYSILVGDTYYSFQRLEPLGTVLGLSADYAELSGTLKDNDIGSIAAKISLSFGKNLTSKTFMSGLSNLLNAISDPERYAENWLEMTAGSIVPMSSLLSWTARIKDNTIRNVQGPKEAIKSKIPGQTQAIRPKVDLWGRKLEYQGSAAYRSLSPARVSGKTDDMVEKELERLGLTPSEPGKSIMGVKLDDEQYYNYQVLSGKFAKRRLDNLIKSDDYKSAGFVEQQSMINQAITSARSEVGYAVLLPTLPGGESILKINEGVRDVKEQAKVNDEKLSQDDHIELREWYMGEMDLTLKQEILPNASAKSKQGWKEFYEIWLQVKQAMYENELSFNSNDMKPVKNWYKEELRITKEQNPEFTKEFGRYPAAAWVKY